MKKDWFGIILTVGPELQKAFGLPETMAACAMLPLGRPVKQLTRLKRNPVEEFTTIDGFAGPRLLPD